MGVIGIARRWRGLLAVVALVGGVCTPAHAVFVRGTVGNTTAPADDFGFDHVAARTSSTAIYLGYGWALTAAHVGPSDASLIELNGMTYKCVAGSRHDLTDPTGTTTYTDLSLFQVRDLETGIETPRMTPLMISASTPSVGSTVTMVGNSWDRDPLLYAWDVGGTFPSGSTGWDWSAARVAAGPYDGDVRGFKKAAVDNRSVRWGTNTIERGYGFFLDEDKTLWVIGMLTDFDEDGSEDEAQVFHGDSGGGVFYKRGDQWELTGLLHAMSVYPDQPGSTVMLNVSGVRKPKTYSFLSDLSAYRDQILDIITPGLGDATLDGIVDERDAAVLALNWRRTDVVLWEDGDFNADGRVDERDASILASHWQGTSEGVRATVPEPGSISMAIGAVAALLVFCRRRRRCV